MDHTRFLIIGASGRVGAHLYRTLSPQRAVATYCNTPLAGGVRFDATRMRLADSVLRAGTRYSHAFLLHGVTNIDACSLDTEAASRLNVEAMRQLVDDLVERGIVPVFASSDAVFDGAQGRLTEDDAARPVMMYGRQKLEIERYLAERAPQAIVVRLAKVVGTGDAGSDMLEQWLAMLDAGREIACARDQVFTPIHVDDAVRAFIGLAEGGHRGLFHAGGPDVVTRLQLLRLLLSHAKPYLAQTPRIRECSLNDLPFAEPRPLDASMASDKLYRALGWQPMGMDEACRRAVASHYGAVDARAAAGATR